MILDKQLDKIPIWLLAIITDILMLIPFIDFVFTVPLQWYIWSKLDNEVLKYVNIGYDLVADFAIPGVGDVIPLNTILVVGMMIMGKKVD